MAYYPAITTAHEICKWHERKYEHSINENRPEVDAPNEERHCQQTTRTNDHSEAVENSNPVTQVQPSSKSSTASMLLPEIQP
uniref:Uncharacterized protein n=1 Tax=Parascaris univalens TaxID=6257 RepID=A0A914ZS48_PARUN